MEINTGNTEESHWIGLVYYTPPKKRLANHIYPWMIRAFALDRALIQRNFRLISYSPEDVDLNKKTVTGYVIDYNRFVKKTVALPKINYNFYIGFYGNKDYITFENWATQNNYEIYPLRAIRRLAGDKLLTAQTIEEYKSAIIPKTKIFDGNVEEMQKFLQKNNSLFIKPRTGSMGENIFVIKKENDKYKISFYQEAKVKSLLISNLSESIPFIKQYSEDDDYILQEGIDVIKYNGSVFDIRAIIFKIDDSWQFLSEIRLGAQTSFLSNIAQGGRSYNTEAFFHLLFKERAPLILDKIKETAIDTVKFLSEKYNCIINELSLDIVLDKDENLYIVELNVKPGLAGTPKMYSNFFLMKIDEMSIYEGLTLKHGEFLANSLISRYQIIGKSYES